MLYKLFPCHYGNGSADFSVAELQVDSAPESLCHIYQAQSLAWAFTMDFAGGFCKTQVRLAQTVKLSRGSTSGLWGFFYLFSSG